MGLTRILKALQMSRDMRSRSVECRIIGPKIAAKKVGCLSVWDFLVLDNKVQLLAECPNCLRRIPQRFGNLCRLACLLITVVY